MFNLRKIVLALGGLVLLAGCGNIRPDPTPDIAEHPSETGLERREGSIIEDLP